MTSREDETNPLRWPLRDARKAAGWSQVRLGDAIGVDERAVKRWERSGGPAAVPDPDHEDALLRVLPFADPDGFAQSVAQLRRRDELERPSALRRLARVEAAVEALEAAVDRLERGGGQSTP